MNEQTDTWAGRYTGKQTDRWTDGQIGRQTDRRTIRQNLSSLMLIKTAFSDGDVNKLRRGADVAMLITAIDSDICGVGKFDSIGSGNTLAVLKKKCAVGYYSFAHEV